VLIFITRGEQVLLIRGAPTKRLWANLYNGIGGHVERGESLLQAACRELHEETGLTPAGLALPGLWLCGILSVDTGTSPGIGVFIFRGVLAEAAPASSDTLLDRAAPPAAAPAPSNELTGYAQPALPPAEIHGYAQFAPSPEGSLHWLHPADLADLPCLPDLPELLPRCLAHTPTSPPFFALSTPGADGSPRITYA
jgi:8-oxo-dGTP diphosphatase